MRLSNATKDPGYSESSSSPRSLENRHNDLGGSLNIQRDFLQRNTGLFLITISQCCFSSMNVAVKKLNSLDTPVPTMELIIVRLGLTGLFSLSYMLVTGMNDPFLGPKGVRLLLLLRGFAGFVWLSGLYLSLQHLSLSDATVLTFLMPIFLVFSGAIFLGESLSGRQVFAGLVSLGGVILIARPTFLFGADTHVPHLWTHTDPKDSVGSTDRLISVGVALLGVLGGTITYTTIRAIGKRAHAMHSMVYYSVVCVLCSTICMVAAGTPIVVPTAIEWLFLLLLIGIFGFFGQLFLTTGLQYETLGRGSVAMYTQIVFAMIFERIFFHTYPTLYSAIGIIVIFGSALYIAISTADSKERAEKTGAIRLPEDDIEEGLLGRRVDANAT